MKPLAAGSVAALLFATAPLRAQHDLADWSGDHYAQLAALPVAPAVEDGHPVHVLVHGENRRLADADVWVVSRAAAPAADRQFLERHHHAAAFLPLATRYATRYRTDANGVARVAMPDDGVCIAVQDALVGVQPRMDGPHGTWVGVRPFARVKVEVVDHLGRPAPGVPVHVRIDGAPGGTLCCTDRIGRAAVRLHLPTPGAKLVAEPAVVDGARLRVAVPDRDIGDRPRLVRVQLPPTVEVAVDLPPALAGLPMQLPIQATVPAPAQLGQLPSAHYAPRTTASGAVFPFVAIGARVQVQADLPHHRTLELLAPAVAGARATHAFEPDGRALVVTGRLLDADGAPVPAERYVQAEPRTSRLAHAPDGRFTLLLDRDALQPHGGRVRLASFAPHDGFAALTIDPTEPPQDLGDVRLAPTPVLVGGRVLTADGEPAAGLQLMIALPDASIGARTDERGAFVLRRAADDLEHVELHLAGPPLLQRFRLAAPAKLRVGRDDHVVRVELARRFELTFRDPAVLPFVRCTATPARGDAHLGVALDGAVQIPAAGDGPHEVVVEFGDRELARVPNATVGDPRLVDLALPDDLHVTSVTTTSNGRPLDAVVCVQLADGTRTQAHPLGRAGRAEVPWLEGQQLVFLHRDHRPLVVAPTAAPMQVELRALARIRLVLPRGRALPDGVRVVMACDLLGAPHEQQARWDHTTPIVLRPPTDGSVDLFVEVLTADGAVTVHEQRVALPPHDQLTDVVLTIDAAAEKRARDLVDGN